MHLMITDHNGKRQRADVCYKHRWVLALDADEVPDAQLIEECLSVVEHEPSDIAAYLYPKKRPFHGPMDTALYVVPIVVLCLEAETKIASGIRLAPSTSIRL